MFRLLVALGAFVTWFATSSEATAYCRQFSCQDDEDIGIYCDRDAKDCIIEGNQLFYARQCLSFSVAEGHAALLGLEDAEFESLVEQAFARWTSVDCGGGRPPGFRIESAGVVAVEEPFFCANVELNTSTWMLIADWPYDSDALGYTTSTYAEDDAEVFDADVELNLEKLLDELPGDRVDTALLSIIVHEAGHFLGLAHSDDPDAVMYASYNRSDLLSRMLTQDDIDGICQVFPPDGAPGSCSEPGVSEAAIDQVACDDSFNVSEPSGCSVAARPSGAPQETVPLALLGLGLLLVRRRATARS